MNRKRLSSALTVGLAFAFFAAWAVFGVLWRARDVAWKPVLTATVVLLALGFLGTFPTFFEAFAD